MELRFKSFLRLLPLILMQQQKSFVFAASLSSSSGGGVERPTSYWRYVPMNSQTIRDMMAASAASAAASEDEQTDERNDAVVERTSQGPQWWNYLTSNGDMRKSPKKEQEDNDEQTDGNEDDDDQATSTTETLFRQPSSAAVNNRIYRPKPAKLSVLVSNLKGQSRQKQRQPASTSSAFPWIAEMQQQNQFGETEEEEEKGEEAATTTLRGGLRRQGEEVTTTLKVKSQRKKESEEDRPPVSSGGAGSSNSFFKETKFVPAPATAATAGVKKDEEGFIQTSSKKVEKIPLSQFLEEIHQGLNENEFRLTTAKDAGSSTTTASTTTATTTTTTTTSTTTTTIPSTMPTFITRRTTTPRNSWMREPSIPHLSDFLFSNAVTSSAKRAFSSKLDSLINNNSRLLIVLQEQLKLQRESLQIMKEMKKALAVATEDNKAAGNNNSDSQLS